MNYETIKKVKSINKKTIVAVAIILVVLGAGYALARPGNVVWNGMMGVHRDMMDNMTGYGNGTTAGYGGMMGDSGPGSGMMGYDNSDNGNDLRHSWRLCWQWLWGKL